MTEVKKQGKTSYGIEWFKGEGSQTHLLSKMTEDTILMVKTYTKNEGHNWGLTNKENLLKITKKNRGLYEIITDKKRKVYFDIDTDKDTLDSVLKKIKEVIPDAELAVSGSVFKNVLCTKYSYHITVNNYHLLNTTQCIGLKQFCKENEDLGFDWKVYTKNRAMKCINQSKPDSRVQEIIEGNIEWHFITTFFPDYSKDAYKLFEKYEEFDSEPVVVNKIKQERRKLDFGLDIKQGSNYFVKETDLINLIPPNEEHRVSFSVAMYLHKLGHDFEEFWTWRERKCNFLNQDKESIRNKWLIKWKEIDHMDNKVSVNTIIRILERYYPNIRKDYYERIFFDYGNPELDKTTDKQYADISIFSKSLIDYLVFPMGSNKTGALIEYLNTHNDKNVIFLNVRRSLAQNIGERLGDEYFHYNDAKRMKQYLKENNEEIPKKISELKRLVLPKINKLITTPYSLHYNKDNTEKYDILVIDEVESFHTAWLSGDIHGPNYNTNWTTFKNLVLNCKKIILLDALYSHNTIRLLERLGIERKDICVSGTTFKYPEMKLINHRDNNRFFTVLSKKIEESKKVYLFWPFKKGSANIYSQHDIIEMLEKSCTGGAAGAESACGRKLKYQIYNADEMNEDSVKESLKDVNESWKDLDLVITNQCITVGVNFDLRDEFDSVFLADTSFVSMREIVQTSRRIRHLKTDEIHYTNISLGKRNTFQMDDNSLVPREYLEDILMEAKGRSFNCISWLFHRTNVNLTRKVYKTTKEFQQYYEEIISDNRYDWDSIKDIDDSDILERLFTCGAGNAEDAVMLIKHKFKDLMNTDNELVLKEAWEFRSSFQKLFKVKESLKEIFSLKSKELKSNDFVISKEQRGTLIKNFSYRGIDYERSCDAKIFADSYNCFIGFDYYKYDHNKKIYEISMHGKKFEYCLGNLKDAQEDETKDMLFEDIDPECIL